jgi:hypothetical protein
MSSREQLIQGYSEKFDELQRRAAELSIPLSIVHPKRFEAIESYEGLTAMVSEELRASGIRSEVLRRAAVRVVFRLSSEADPAFIRISANFCSGLLEFGDFDSRRRVMMDQRFNIKFHAEYLARGNEAHTLMTGARLIQLAVAALHLEREGHSVLALGIWRLLATGYGEMPPELGPAPSFPPSKLFTL